MEEFVFVANEEDEGKRVDVFLTSKMNEISRSYVQKLIDEDLLKVNEKVVKSSYKLKLDDEVVFMLKELETIEAIPEDIDIDIIYEDESLAVVNKQRGMVVHPAIGNTRGTLVNALLFHLKNLSGINGVIRPGIVHRIDKDTSGILVIAKTDEAHRKLSEQLKDHSMKREYFALVEGVIKNDEGTVDKPLGRDPKDRLKMAIVPNGKRAVTHYKVLARYKNTTLVRLRLETGRTHQIRVHMASIGHPVCSDPIYSSKKNRTNAIGQLLHARLLGFIHPKTGQYVEFRRPIPEDFFKVLNKKYKESKLS